ncbi:HTH-type transcriptional activator RhaS [Oligella sp. MSHR50489EDL]|uniref:helix-turn-helix transcriptional regulator n=1 Tax=Oligella sp. MSHR50489EDL TaxID=3139409 RepID=UPI003D81B53C
MSGKFLHSDHLLWLLKHDQAHDLINGQYLFKELHSGLSIHGGSICPSQTLKSGRLTNRYVNLIVLLEGHLRFAINEHQYHIDAGNTGKIILIAPEHRSLFTRYLVSGEASIKIAIKGIERWLDDEARDSYPGLYLEPVRIRLLDSEQRNHSLDFLKQLLTVKSNSLTLDYAALKLLDELWADFAEDCSEATHPTGANRYADFLEKLTEVYRPQLNAEELASALHLSERTLQRRIKAYLNCSLREWMQREKMIFALKLLTQNRLSISEVSYECGYQHVSNFTQAFKQFFDATPAEIQRSDFINTTKAIV